MASFKTAKREYVLSLSVNSLAVVREALGLHLAELDRAEEGQPPLAVRLWVDPLLCASVVYWCLRAQPASFGTPPGELAEFLQDLEGDGIANAQRALLDEALPDFFRKGRRPDQAELIEKTKVSIDQAAAHQIAMGNLRIADMRQMMDLQIEEHQAATAKAIAERKKKIADQAGASGLPGDSPASPASTPAD